MKKINNSLKRQGYEAPHVEVIAIEYQGMICISDDGGSSATPGTVGNSGVHFGTNNGQW